MRLTLLVSVVATSGTTLMMPAMAFSPSLASTTTAAASSSTQLLSMTSTGMSGSDYTRTPQPEQRSRKMSIAIPVLQCPPTLHNSDLAGNFGFDPLNLAKNQEQLWDYREAEIKHARLAMLAAIGWPTSELMDRAIADVFDAPAMLDEYGRVPTLLNGGMERVSPVWWGFCVGMCAAIDMYGVAKARRCAPDYFPGNLGFDPMNFFPQDKMAQEQMKLAEIKHGRVAMIGVLGYVIEEYLTKMAVVEDTPALFQPITETVGDALMGAEQIIEGTSEMAQMF